MKKYGTYWQSFHRLIHFSMEMTEKQDTNNNVRKNITAQRSHLRVPSFRSRTTDWLTWLRFSSVPSDKFWAVHFYKTQQFRPKFFSSPNSSSGIMYCFMLWNLLRIIKQLQSQSNGDKDRCAHFNISQLEDLMVVRCWHYLSWKLVMFYADFLPLSHLNPHLIQNQHPPIWT
jgi:hypothetical protein